MRILYIPIFLAASLGAQTPKPCDSDADRTDCRSTFQASGFLGLAIDSFAAQDLRQYYNPQEANKILSSRSVFGINFAYRLSGNEEIQRPAKRIQRLNNLWVYGETAHGVRSADVDCTANSHLPSCKNRPGDFAGDPARSALYILRNATSLEGHAGFRYEFLGLQQQSSNPANLYVNAKAGFLNVAGLGADLANLSHIGIGAVATKGDFQDSHLEVGVGRSDLYKVNPNRRLKIDGYIQRTLPRTGNALSFFVQMLVDADGGKGADSVQTYVGVNIDLAKFH
ncbi:MAG: hypothetical protein FJW30_17435 [Acidobacteria bacterium]|nr:hypothetical protein [Acidobacteriota bacterium]